MRDSAIEKANIAARFTSGKDKNITNPTLTPTKETGSGLAIGAMNVGATNLNGRAEQLTV